VRVGRNVRILRDDLEAYLRPEGEEHARLDCEESQRLLNEARRLLQRLRTELPQHYPPSRREIEPQQDLANGRLRQTNGQGHVDAGTREAAGQGRRVLEEYKRASGGNGRKF